MGWLIGLLLLYALLRIARVAGSSGTRQRRVKKLDADGVEHVEVWTEQTSSRFERIAARVFLLVVIIFTAELLRELHVWELPTVWQVRLEHWL